MKKRTPILTYSADRQYPSAADGSRRAFLTGLAATAGATAAAWIGLRPGQAAPRKYERVVLQLSRGHGFSGCDYVVETVIAQTRDPALAAFLRDEKRLPAIEEGVLRLLQDSTCADVTAAKRLARLEAKLAAAVSVLYRSAMKRTPGSLITNLVLTKRRIIHRPGVAPRPILP